MDAGWTGAHRNNRQSRTHRLARILPTGCHPATGSRSGRIRFLGGLLLALGLAPMGAAVAETSLHATLAEQIAKLAGDPKLASMRIGIRVETLGPSPVVIYEQASDQLFKPASNQKILTTATGLCTLPADFKYETILARRGNDLVIIGSGDPSTGDPRLARQADRPTDAIFHEWATRLKAGGVTRIAGDLVYDDHALDLEHVHPNWPSQFNMQSWYTAPVGGLNYYDNCVDLVITPGKQPGQAVSVTVIPDVAWIRLDNKAKTAAKGEPVIKRKGSGPLTVSVEGSVSRPSTAASPFSMAITDPGAFFASACRASLTGQGIQIAGHDRREQVRIPGQPLPPNLQVVAVHESPLPEFLWRINKSSMNMFAEAMLKTVGAYTGPGNTLRQGTLENGRAAMNHFLASLGLPENLYAIDDGSGLSHNNRVAPVVLTTVLQHMDRHPRRELWWANLATPGENGGTLSQRMKDIEGKVFGKTGYIGGVASLSGYVLGPDGQRYTFSILCNDTQKIPNGATAARGLQDAICRTLATNGQRATTTADP
ncbi:MAG: D-alanyl-D-alanine carboxypeptidase/D-alanyl-D-alanine-endopeptidase [Phycisphaerae bacterium]|nr:D-alanyl-D-alanine carboxypeptidase/D-alanyl-D-alanine-endopeptidase [Phycisphaerae bacterium]